MIKHFALTPAYNESRTLLKVAKVQPGHVHRFDRPGVEEVVRIAGLELAEIGG